MRLLASIMLVLGLSVAGCTTTGGGSDYDTYDDGYDDDDDMCDIFDDCDY